MLCRDRWYYDKKKGEQTVRYRMHCVSGSRWNVCICMYGYPIQFNSVQFGQVSNK